jgi:hypothetical protein
MRGDKFSPQVCCADLLFLSLVTFITHNGQPLETRQCFMNSDTMLTTVLNNDFQYGMGDKERHSMSYERHNSSTI